MCTVTCLVMQTCGAVAVGILLFFTPSVLDSGLRCRGTVFVWRGPVYSGCVYSRLAVMMVVSIDTSDPLPDFLCVLAPASA